MATSLRGREEKPLDLRRDNRFFSHMGVGIDRQIDDLFEGSFSNGLFPVTRGMYSPRIDVKETTDAVKIAAEMPGIDEKDIDVSVHDGMLTITGEKKVAKEDNELGYHRIERLYGCFTGDVALPDMVKTDKIESAFKNGVFTVTLPKTQKGN